MSQKEKLRLYQVIEDSLNRALLRVLDKRRKAERNTIRLTIRPFKAS